VNGSRRTKAVVRRPRKTASALDPRNERSMRSRMSPTPPTSPANDPLRKPHDHHRKLGVRRRTSRSPPPRAGGRLLYRATDRAPDASLSWIITQSIACFASFINQNQERLCIITAPDVLILPSILIKSTRIVPLSIVFARWLCYHLMI
jgi:hypothetical protein